MLTTCADADGAEVAVDAGGAEVVVVVVLVVVAACEPPPPHAAPTVAITAIAVAAPSSRMSTPWPF